MTSDPLPHEPDPALRFASDAQARVERERTLAALDVDAHRAVSRATRFRRLRSLLVRVMEWFPWTPLGIVLAALAYAALEWMARAQLDLVWLVIAYAGLALLGLCPIAVLIGAVWFRLRRPLTEHNELLTLETGTFGETGFRVALPWYVPLIQARWEWMTPLSSDVECVRRGRFLEERVRLSERGSHEHVERRLRISDSFGLSRVLLRLRQDQAVDVLPRLGGLRYLPALQALASGDAVPHPMGVDDGDRLDLRRYSPGDPARFIHWKVLARTGKLMVRTKERALTHAHRTAAFLLAGQDDDASAAVARLAIERRLLGVDWVFGSDRDLAGSSKVGEALAILMRSPEGRAHAGEGLSTFIERAERAGPVSVLVFAPSRPGPWLERVVEVARARRVSVVIGTDGVQEARARSRFARLLARSDAPVGTPIPDLEQVLRTLGRVRATTIVLDRGTGRQLASADRRVMLGMGTEPAWGVQ